MTSNALQQLAAISNLKFEWNDFWKRAKHQKSRGIDGLSPSEFNKNLPSNLAATRQELLGQYSFQSLVPLPFPKTNGKIRIICVPTVRDRLVQRALGAKLRDYHDRLGINNDASFGFLPSTPMRPKGVVAARDQALKLRRQFPFAYKSDIASFFDTIPRDRLRVLVDRLPTPTLRTLIKSTIDCEIETDRDDLKRVVREAGIVPGIGVRQGMPLSPFFANLVLRDFDRTLIKAGYQLVRYADDFIILASDRKACLEADRVVRELLATLGFSLPELGEANSKTKICAPQEPVDFLGLSLEPDSTGGYQLRFSEKQLDEIRRRLYRFKSCDQCVKEKLDISTLGKVMDNAINGYRSAYDRDLVGNWDALGDILASAKQTVFTSIFREMFGQPALNKLGVRARAFLCI